MARGVHRVGEVKTAGAWTISSHHIRSQENGERPVQAAAQLRLHGCSSEIPAQELSSLWLR